MAGKGFSISLNLQCLFSDHRVVSRIFVNKSCKIISDLIEHIKNVFNIDVDIRLLHENEYLPECEDVRVLNQNDSIVAILTKKGRKQLQQPCKTSICNSPEDPKPRPLKVSKKKGKERVIDVDYIDLCENEQLENPLELMDVASPPKKIKKCKTKRSNSDLVLDNIQAETVSIAFQSPKKLPKPSPKINESKEEKIEIISVTKIQPFIDSTIANESSMEIPPPTMQQQLIEPVPIISSSKVTTVEDSDEINVSSNTDMLPYRGNTRHNRKQYFAVGSILNMLRENADLKEEIIPKNSTESDSLNKEEPIIEVPEIAKRKRHRVRHRKKKVSILPTPNVSINGHCNGFEFIPPKTSASPKLHIRFDCGTIEPETKSLCEEEIESEEIRSNNGSVIEEIQSLETNAVQEVTDATVKINEMEEVKMNSPMESSPESLGFVTQNIRYHPNKKFNYLIDDQSAKQFPKIGTGFPQKNDIICFKILKMDNSFCPVISSFLTGHVLDFCKETKTVNLQILAGRDQLEVPVGKLILSEDGKEEMEPEPEEPVHEMNWHNLIEPRLCFP